MELRSFRFLHAADFRLDTPCFGVPDLTPELLRLFIDARYRAAQNVFDTAIAGEVDFVVLAGELLDSTLPGLRGPLFLIDQIKRLAEHRIKVYWAGATFLSNGRWPRHAPLPSNLRLFARGASSQIHEQGKRPIARLVLAEDDPVRPLNCKLFTIAIHPQGTTAVCDGDATIDYWAFGGRSPRETLTISGNRRHFPGSPQGRTPDEVGPHGCSLVTVSGAGNVSIEPIATDVVRWCREELTISNHTSWAEAEQQFSDRLDQLRDELASSPTVELAIVSWTVTGSGLAMQRLLQPQIQHQLLSRGNARSPSQPPTIWNLELNTIIDAHQLDDWQSESSSLGAFLRELAEMSDSLQEGPVPAHAPRPFCEHLRRKVTNEGIQRLGKELLTT